MTKGSKCLALMSAICLATSGLSAEAPFLCAGVLPQTELLLDFHKQISQLSASRAQQQTGFASLSYDSDADCLYRDGTAVDSSCDGFVVVDGELMVERQSLTGALPSKARKQYLTLEEAEKLAGCEVVRNDSEVTVVSPFQNARLIVQSSQKLDALNATDVVDGIEDLTVLQFASAADAYAAYQIYQETEGVVFVEPDRTFYVADADAQRKERAEKYQAEIHAQAEKHALENDSVSWGVSAISADTYCEWLTESHPELPELTVAVIDTGIYDEHTWFEGRIAEGGRSFVLDDDGIPDDLHGHGSHCAGIVCSSTPDSVKILPIQVLDEFGYGGTLEIYCGMRYALEQGADVISMSLGGYGESPLMNQAAAAIYDAEIPLCVAAGNETMDVMTSCPANYPDVMTVSAVTSNNQLAYFSNFGEGIDFAAPGEDILSVGLSDPTDLVLNSGTSMATPFVAAVCADILSVTPDLTADEVYGYLKTNAIDLGATGFDSEFGWGMVNLADFKFVSERCEAPVASISGGSFDEPFVVTLESATKDAKIYYTLDGSLPDQENGILYDGTEIAISESVKLQAIAYDENTSSILTKERYILNEKDTANCFEIQDGVLISYRGVLDEISLDAWDGLDITEIGKDAFKDNRSIYSIALPETVTKIGEGAFRSTELVELYAPGVTEIGAYAFDHCMMLNTVSFGTVTTLGEGCFASCTSVENFGDENVFSELTVIPDEAFENCNSLPSLNFKNVTEIADSAFYGVLGIGNRMFDWKKITFIGDFAFFASGISGDIPLKSLKTIGKYAFGATGITSIRLPESITEIPEGLLLECLYLTNISAPAITKVDAYGLGLSAIFEPMSLTYDFDCSAITELGESAFFGFSFNKPETFSSLQAQSVEIFACAWAPAISLPNCTRLEEPLNVSCYCIDILNLENVEFIGKNTMIDVSTLVVGEACKTVEKGAIKYATRLAGPEDSPLKQLANPLDAEYIVTPKLDFQNTCYQFLASNPSRIEAKVLGFDYACQWYRQQDDVLEPIAGATTKTLDVDTSETGEFTYVFRILDDGEVIDEIKYSVEVVLPTYEAALSDGGHMMVSWDKTTTEHFYEFTPEADDTYHFWLSNVKDVSVTVGGLSMEQPATMKFDTDSTDDLEVELKAGNTYYVHVAQDTTSDSECSMLYCSLNPRTDYVTLTSAMVSLEFSEMQVENASQLPLTPNVTLTYRTKTLTENKDYVLVYNKNDSIGTAEVLAFGIGAYQGCAAAQFTITAKIQADQPMKVTVSEQAPKAILTFIPETTGDYLIQTGYTDSVVTAALDGTLDRADVYNFSSEFEVHDASDYLGMCMTWYTDTVIPLPASLSLYMEKGKEYTIVCSAADLQKGDQTYSVSIKKDKSSITDCQVSVPDIFHYADGTSDILFDDIVLIDLYTNELLVENVDYEIQYYACTAEGYLNIVLSGIGKYSGTIISYPALDVSGSGDQTLISEIRLDEPFVMTETNAVYALTIEEMTKVQFVDAAGLSDDVSVDVCYYDDEYEVSVMETTLQHGDSYILEPKTYQLEIHQSKPVERSLMMKNLGELKALNEAEITIANQMYTGSEITPDVTVVLDGVTLTENVDYIVESVDDKEFIDPGEYEVKIKGIGKYTGTAYSYFQIVYPLDEDAPLLTLGKTTVTIDQPSEIATYRWIPEDSFYLLSNRQLEDVSIQLFDESGALIGYLKGLAEQESEFYVSPDTTYYLTICYSASAMTGEIVFELTDDFRMMYNAEISCPDYVKLTDGETIPEFEVRYEDELLQEGVDYCIASAGNVTRVGQAEIVLRGLGRYFGTTLLSYIIYEDFPDIEPTELLLDEENLFLPWDLGETALYSFTAPEEGTYTLSIAGESSVPAVITYCEDGTLIDSVWMPYDIIELAAGETVYFWMISPVIEDYLAGFWECTFYVEKNGTYNESFTKYGVTYSVDSYYTAVAVGFDPEYAGYLIPTEFYDEENDIYYAVLGIDSEVFDQLTDKTIYLDRYEDNFLVELCKENGLCFAYCDAPGDLPGDVTLDGELNANDAATLLRWLNEGMGMMMYENAYHLADMNADGNVDVLDVVAILNKIQYAS